jgi:arabinan endo-1,5-alpha-L-arabinosidase
MIKRYLFLMLMGLCSSVFVSEAQNAESFIPPSYSDDYSAVASFDSINKWAAYNVHDPSCIKADDGYYYLYSTDAIYMPFGMKHSRTAVKPGNIMVRRSLDLVNWEYKGWAFDSIPSEAVEYVKKASGGFRPNGIWAPYISKYKGIYRLYYCVSAFGKNTSYIGMAESKSAAGPWNQIGCVVKTDTTNTMNAIDPTVVTDAVNGNQWMVYGSYFSGIHEIQLNPETGLAMIAGDHGKCVARRLGGDTAIIEAPEIIYNPLLKKYFLFVSYDPLFSTYNVRVGRSDKPDGPFLDINGNDMAKVQDNIPVLTYAYRFTGHPGWAGVAHCGVFNDNGTFYMVHQGRLAPDNLMMDLHVRRIYWTPDGWPVVSPERYAGVPQCMITDNQLIGKWEVIQLRELGNSVKLWQGQIPGGGWKYDTARFNNSFEIKLLANGKVEGLSGFSWSFNNDVLILKNESDNLSYNLMVGREWDWENKNETIIFTGIGAKGYSFWGKLLKEDK